MREEMQLFEICLRNLTILPIDTEAIGPRFLNVFYFHYRGRQLLTNRAGRRRCGWNGASVLTITTNRGRIHFVADDRASLRTVDVWVIQNKACIKGIKNHKEHIKSGALRRVGGGQNVWGIFFIPWIGIFNFSKASDSEYLPDPVVALLVV